MKKLFTLILALVAFASYGQLTSTTVGNNSIHMKTTLTSAVDSVVVTNSGSGFLYMGFLVKEAKSIHVLITKTSGTFGGTMTLYGSNDGVNWSALTDTTSTPTITALTVADSGTYSAPQQKLWKLGWNNFKYYRVGWVGTGTMVGQFKSIVYF